MCRSNPLRDSRGYTLVELLITLIIVVLLAAIVIPFYSSALRKSRSAALATDGRKLYSALMRYSADHGSFPAEASFDLTNLAPLTDEGYFPNPEGFTKKLAQGRLLLYMAPDVGGANQQFVSVMRLARDPSVIVAVVYTNVIDATDGWVDGVYVITNGELEEADEVG